jgi:toxin YoeB
MTPEFVDDLRWWIETNRPVALRVLKLVDAIAADAFNGMGKPEPLKYWVSNAWSRRVTDVDRIVYLVENERISFLQCRYHY